MKLEQHPKSRSNTILGSKDNNGNSKSNPKQQGKNQNKILDLYLAIKSIPLTEILPRPHTITIQVESIINFSTLKH